MRPTEDPLVTPDDDSGAPPPVSGTAGRSLSARVRTLAPAVLPLLLVVVLFGPHLIGVRSLSPADQLYNWEPWASQRPADATLTHNAPLSDNFDGIFPQRHELVTRLRSGDWPLWSPRASGGADLAPSVGVAAAAPSNLVALVTPGWYTPGLLKALELVGAWTFVFLFLRRVGTRRWPAGIAGVMFALSGFQVVWVNWPHTRVSMFVAGLLWAFDRLIERTTPGRIGVAVLVVGATILEGFPAVAAIGMGAAAIVLGFRLVQLSDGVADAARRAAGAAVAGVLGAMLSAITIVPFASRLGSYGFDRGVPADAPVARGLGTLLAPNVLGPAEQYFGPINYIEIGGFVGAAALLACGTGVLVTLFGGRPQAKDLLLLLTVGVGSLMLLYSFGVEPLYDLFRRLPVLSTNPAMRVKASGLLLMALGAGLSLDRLCRPIPARQLRWAATIWTLLLTAGAAAYLMTFVRTAPAELRDYVQGEATRAIVLAVVAALAVIALVNRGQVGRVRVAAIGVIAAVVVVDAVAWVLPYWPRSEPDELYPATSSHEFLADALAEERFASLGLTFFPGTSGYYGLRNVGGHNFFDQRWAESLVAAGALLRSPTFVSFEDPASASSPVLDRLGVAYWADPSGVARCRSDAPPADITRRDDSGVTVEATGPDLRGLTVTPSRRLERGTTLALRARTDDGDVLLGERTLSSDSEAGNPLTVMVPQLETRDGAVALELTSDAPLGSTTAVTLCRAQADGLVLAHVGGAWIYERTTALPRLRWASDALAIEDPDDRLAAITSGEVADDTVVLSEPTDLPGGGTGTVELVDDSSDTLELAVDADGPGFLVVADPIQHGWTASVDGEPVEILAADHAGGAVAIPAGEHSVVLNYDPPGVRTGMLISGLAVLAVLALFAVSAIQWVRRRRS